MKRFAALFAELDATTRTSAKVASLARYLAEAPPEDRLWTVALFSGRRPRRVIPATRLALWAAEAAAIPDWLFTDAYAVAGDLAETITLILPPPRARPRTCRSPPGSPRSPASARSTRRAAAPASSPPGTALTAPSGSSSPSSSPAAFASASARP